MSDLLGIGSDGPETGATIPTVTERLEGRRTQWQQELARTDEALAALKANPEIERVFDLVQRALRGY